MGQGGQIPALAVPLGVLVVLHGPVRAFRLVVDHGAVDGAPVPDGVAAAQGTPAVDGAAVQDGVQVVQGDSFRNGQGDPLMDAQGPVVGEGHIFGQGVVAYQIEFTRTSGIFQNGIHSSLQGGIAHAAHGGHRIGWIDADQSQAAEIQIHGPAAHIGIAVHAVPLQEESEDLIAGSSACRGHHIVQRQDAVLVKSIVRIPDLCALIAVCRGGEEQHIHHGLTLHPLRGLELEGKYIVALFVGSQVAGDRVEEGIRVGFADGNALGNGRHRAVRHGGQLGIESHIAGDGNIAQLHRRPFALHLPAHKVIARLTGHGDAAAGGMAAAGHLLGAQHLIQELIGDGVVGDRGTAAAGGRAAAGNTGGGGGGAAGHVLVPGGDAGGALGGLHLGVGGGYGHVVGVGGDVIHLAGAGDGGARTVGGDALHRTALAHGNGGVGGGCGQIVHRSPAGDGDAGTFGLLRDGEGVHGARHGDLGFRPGHVQGAHGTRHDDGVGAVVNGDDLHRGVVLHRQAYPAVPPLGGDGANRGVASNNDGVLAAAPDHQGAFHGDVVQNQVPVADALGGDQVAVNGHVGQRDPGGADDHVAGGVGGVAACLIIAGGNGVVQ